MNAAAPSNAIAPHHESHLWLCRKHRIAGVPSEPICCAAASPVSARERSLWYSERIARKPPEVRTHITLAKRDVDGCMNAIARCAHAHGKLWIRTRVSAATPLEGVPETVRLR